MKTVGYHRYEPDIIYDVDKNEMHSPAAYVVGTVNVLGTDDEFFEVKRGDMVNDTTIFIGGLQVVESATVEDDGNDNVWTDVPLDTKKLLTNLNPTLIFWNKMDGIHLKVCAASPSFHAL